VKRKNNPGDLVIVNLQETPLDVIASLRIFAKCDDVSKLLAKKLSVEIPAFHLKRSDPHHAVNVWSSQSISSLME